MATYLWGLLGVNSCIQVFKGDGWCGGSWLHVFGDSWGIMVVLKMLGGRDIMGNDDKGFFNQLMVGALWVWGVTQSLVTPGNAVPWISEA